jgi:hypothetical protein
MQWTPRGARLLLQTRTKVLNDDLKSLFPSKVIQEQSAANPSPSPIAAVGVLEKLEEQARRVQELASSPTPVQSPSADAMTPAGIMATLDKVTPMMREDLAKSYIGVPVDWKLPFFVAETSERFDGKKMIPLHSLWPQGEQGPFVTGELPVERAAELKTVAKGETVRVKGTIKAVYSSSISVEVSEFYCDSGRQ